MHIEKIQLKLLEKKTFGATTKLKRFVAINIWKQSAEDVNKFRNI